MTDTTKTRENYMGHIPHGVSYAYLRSVCVACSYSFQYAPIYSARHIYYGLERLEHVGGILRREQTSSVAPRYISASSRPLAVTSVYACAQRSRVGKIPMTAHYCCRVQSGKIYTILCLDVLGSMRLDINYLAN